MYGLNSTWDGFSVSSGTTFTYYCNMSGEIGYGITSDSSPVYFETIAATCTENQIDDKISYWTYSPLSSFDEFNSCISTSRCNFSMSENPIEVTEGSDEVGFSPYKNALGEVSDAFEPVEVGGKIIAFCANQGHIFDPEKVTAKDNMFVSKIVAECVSNVVNIHFPGWLWLPQDPRTEEEILPHFPHGTRLPKCGKNT